MTIPYDLDVDLNKQAGNANSADVRWALLKYAKKLKLSGNLSKGVENLLRGIKIPGDDVVPESAALNALKLIIEDILGVYADIINDPHFMSFQVYEGVIVGAECYAQLQAWLAEIE